VVAALPWRATEITECDAPCTQFGLSARRDSCAVVTQGDARLAAHMGAWHA
jgi:hypothetical protein